MNINSQVGEPISLSPRFLFVIRLMVALIWFCDGLQQEISFYSARDVPIVRLFADSHIALGKLWGGAGRIEILLAVFVLSGLFARPLAWLQIVVIVVMNLAGTSLGYQSIYHTTGLLINDLPLLFCISLIGLCGPGHLKVAASPNHE